MITRARRKFLDNCETTETTYDPLPTLLLYWLFSFRSRFPSRERSCLFDLEEESSFVQCVCVCVYSVDGPFSGKWHARFSNTRYIAYRFIFSNRRTKGFQKGKEDIFPLLYEMIERLVQLSRLTFPEMQITRWHPRSSSRVFRRARLVTRLRTNLPRVFGKYECRDRKMVDCRLFKIPVDSILWNVQSVFINI